MMPQALRPQLAGVTRGLSLRDRRLLTAAAVLVAVAALWLLAVRPAWRIVQGASALHAHLDQTLVQAQALAREAQALRSVPAVTPEQTRAALSAAIERWGGRAKLSLQGDRAVLTVTAVGLDELVLWLEELRAGARTRPVEMELARTGAHYSGSLILALSREP